MDYISRYVTEDDDIAFEYELQSTAEKKVTWKRYIGNWKALDRNRKPFEHIVWLYERFFQEFPRDQDVWEEYIKWIMDCDELSYCLLADLFKRCLANFSKGCEKVCLMFLKFAIKQYDLGLIRIALDECVARLPRESHANIWELVLPFIYEVILPLTKVNDAVYEEKSEELSNLINRSLFSDKNGKEKSPKGDIWSASLLSRYLEVCPQEKLHATLGFLNETDDYSTIYSSFNKVLSQESRLEPNVKLPYHIHTSYLRILKQLKKYDEYKDFSTKMQSIFPKQKAELIVELAKSYINATELEDAELLLNSAIESTVTIADFSLIYNFYLDYEKAYIENVMKELKNKSVSGDIWEPRLIKHMDSLQRLTAEHELKLSDVKLRQNPNSIEKWFERVNLFESIHEKCEAYAQAILKIDSRKVTKPGALGELWCRYAQLYWDAGDYDNAREVWNSSLKVPYPYLEDLEGIWISWVENELKREEDGVQNAIRLLKTALKVPDFPELLMDSYEANKKKAPAQTVLFSSLKLWSFLLDLVESLYANEPNGIDETVKIYEEVIALKVATPLIFINYAHFMQDRQNILESFQIYERAIGTFPPETQYEIWNIYLAEASNEDTPLSNEHIRDLFDQALENLVPNKIDCKSIFVLYSNFEEKCGFATRSVDILLQGCRNTESISNKMIMWQICLSKAKLLLGNSESRKFYEECIQTMPNSKITSFVIEFALMETEIGENNRAREIFRYGALLLPPTRNEELWRSWDRFELENGNKDTYKDMLVLKRSLERDMRVDTEFESKSDGNIAFVAASDDKTVNPEEIDLDI